MDDIDIRIIKILSKNSRTTLSEISGTINLSVPAISERIKKLELSGIIQQYTTILNPRILKKDMTTLMFITLERPKFFDKFIEAVTTFEDIIECHSLAGDYDYLLKICTENTASLERLVSTIKSIQGVNRTKSIVVLSSKKKNYSPIN